MTQIKTPKKLIEVALPLDAINEACAHEKQPGIGAHPRGIHLWWARRPLAAARSVIFAQMVNDPGYQQGDGFKFGVNKEKAAIERDRLFKIIEDLVKWENTNNEEVLSRARAEIVRSWRETCELNKDHPQAAELFNPENLPAFHDPFAGGGALPLEAQRLGLESYASDLNPVAVTINKAMIEIPPKFVDNPPVGPRLKEDKQAKLSEDWSGSKGLAEDVRRYGSWIQNQAKERIGHVYPQIEISHQIVTERPDLKMYLGKKLNITAWLWARTVKSPNPVFNDIDVPLISSYILSSKSGKEAYIEPKISGNSYKFDVNIGVAPDNFSQGTKLARGANFECIISKTPIEPKYIKNEAQHGRMGTKLIAVIAEGVRGKVFLAPDIDQEKLAKNIETFWSPEVEISGSSQYLGIKPYGITKFSELFTSRELFVLATLSDLVLEAISVAEADAIKSGFRDDNIGIDSGGTGAKAYSEAIGVYLSFSVDRLVDYGSTISTWKPSGEQVMQTFKRQAIAMTWDFPESNLLNEKAICWLKAVSYTANNLDVIGKLKSLKSGVCLQADAQNQSISSKKVISTDPPYYDNVPYSDLSDFFYVWLRRCLKQVYPSLYATISSPKHEELVAFAYRHKDGKHGAEAFFLDGMTSAMHNLAEQSHPAFPVTIYYAFKQSDTNDASDTTNTGWDTFLAAVIQAGFMITGTWPMRTELNNRIRSSSSNALASSVVLVCKKRDSYAHKVTRREFLRELNGSLPQALLDMTRGGVNSPVAPVDLSQAIIGPGMAIFSQYAAVLEADGKPMSVRTALQLINRFFAEDDFDHDTQFCLHWFDSVGWASGKFGDADVLARAKGTSVGGLVEAGVAESSGGNLRLLRWAELPKDWSPETDTRLPIWEALHHLIRALNQDGETSAGSLLARIPGRAESIRALAYRLYTLCERKGWAEEARAYNELVSAWNGIELASQDTGVVGSQGHLDI